MITREELLKSSEYWFEANQNDVFAEVRRYLDAETISQTDLAEKLNVSKGYISQILNGNANFTMKTLVEFFISIGKVPQISFLDLEEVIKQDQKKRTSEDRFFNDPKNIAAVEQGIADIKAGKHKTLDPNKSLWENIL